MTYKTLKERLEAAKANTNAFAALQAQVDAITEFLKPAKATKNEPAEVT